MFRLLAYIFMLQDCYRNLSFPSSSRIGEYYPLYQKYGNRIRSLVYRTRNLFRGRGEALDLVRGNMEKVGVFV